MPQAIPRTLVASALGVPESDLPPGDLPLDRLATRFLAYTRAGDGETVPEGHPDAWTYALFDDLTRAHPALALAALRATLAACASPEDVAMVAAGPLEDLIAENGAAVIGEIEALAASAPRFAYALTGVWQRETPPLLWARIEAARAGADGLDDGAPLPAAGGLG
ncbi:DUF6869 domain-containing protein [Sinisalibacter aestuarii]|uniref:DUF6869 domain-containing protein n=1 Tax=Sinisalibacter aestuarii TaxID=2949426 RepID=A0ABQ5LTT2_9RHOB|nr:hypothetical protein [Sinisalibacter aestuarii]GKY87820.1 hypothetical protein STA1M1_16890 [Sinisalibacter aestuarii]